eukprot:7054336-Pyramimonas_sp.AAC.1
MTSRVSVRRRHRGVPSPYRFVTGCRAGDLYSGERDVAARRAQPPPAERASRARRRLVATSGDGKRDTGVTVTYRLLQHALHSLLLHRRRRPLLLLRGHLRYPQLLLRDTGVTRGCYTRA